MDNNDRNVTKSEAKSTLKSLASIEKETNKALRPPLWLIIIMSFLYGMITFSWAATRHENLWMLVLIISTITFLLAIAFYLYTNRLLGVKPKLVPKTKSEFLFHLLTGVFFAVIITLTRIFSSNDIWWASYIGGVTNALVLAYLLYNYSTVDFKTSIKQHD